MSACGLFGSWRRPSWWATLAGISIFALSLPVISGAIDIANPHDSSKPKFCLNCHTAEIYAKNCNEPEGFCLLAGSVDGLCLICHIKEECCRPGLQHLPKIHLGMKNHPSDLDVGKIPRAYYPKTLPVYQGRITCSTCHLHFQEKPGGYKMLRLVTITKEGVDWTVLCHDCHKDF